MHCTTLSPHAPRMHLAQHRYALLSTRQYASAFNQPLSVDTSSVTDMRYMFSVRSALRLAPCYPQSGPSPVHASAMHRTALPPHVPRISPHIVMPSFG